MAKTPKPTTPKHLLSGTIRTQKGHPVPHLTVKAYDKKAGQRLWSVGKGQTNAQGFYQIDYSKKVTEAMEEFGADLLIRVYDADKDLLGESPVLVNAPREAQIHVRVSDAVFRGPSAFERLRKQIGALVDADELWELEEEDFAYLAAKLKINEEQIARFCKAFHLEAEAKPFGGELVIPATTFYALIREGEQPMLPKLVGLRKAVLCRRLQEAIGQEIIPQLGEEQIEEQVKQLKELAVAIALQGAEGEEYSLKGLLDISPKLSQRAKENYIRHSLLTPEEEEAGQSFGAKSLKVDKDVAAIQDLEKMADLSGKNLSLVRALQEELQDAAKTKYQQLRYFAKQSKKEWSAFLKKRKIRLPKTENGRRVSRTAYAEQLTGAFKGAFPMVDLVQTMQMSKVLPKSRQPSATFLKFFDQNPDFNLSDDAIDDYWEKAHLKGIKKQLQQSLLLELHTWQRVYKLLHKDPQQNKRLIVLMAMEPPMDSALKIAQVSKASFVDRWTKLRKKTIRMEMEEIHAEAAVIHQRASMLAFMVTTTSWKYNAALDAIRPMVIPPVLAKPKTDLAPKAKNTPANQLSRQNYLYDTSTLIDRPYYYEVPDCESVLSPAAYLQELLYLPQSVGTEEEGYPKVADVINQRRLDISLLKASAHNTNTKLPYIDLVNELLERMLAWDQTDQWSFDLQTTRSEEDLALQPENQFSPVYIKPTTYTFHLSLPWDKWYTEACLYLDYLGLPLATLIEKFEPAIFSNDVFDFRRLRTNQWKDISVMQAQLSLPQANYELLVQNLSDRRLLDIIGISDGAMEEAKQLAVLMPKLNFWQKNKEGETGAKELILLRDMLGSKYLQDAVPEGQAAIEILFPADPFAASLNQISKDIIIRMVKFERLRRQLGWTPRELHQGIMVFAKRSLANYKFGTDIFSYRLLLQLSHVQRLRKHNDGISVLELLSWWGPMESGAGFVDLSSHYQEEETVKRLYEMVFLDRSLYVQGDAELDEEGEWRFFRLNENGYELKEANEHTITAHGSLVSSALNLRGGELGILIGFLTGEHKWAIQPIVSGLKNPNYYFFRDQLNLKNLSVLYKVVSLARYLQITIAEFILVYRLLQLDIFRITEKKGFFNLPPTVLIETEQTLLFVESVQRIQASPFSIGELAYLWQHQINSEQDVMPVQQRIQNLMTHWKLGLEVPVVEQLDPHVIILQEMHDPAHIAVQKEHSEEEIEDFEAILKGTYLGAPGVELTTEQNEQLKQRVQEIFPNHTLQGNEQKDKWFDLMISHFSSAGRGARSNWMYSTIMKFLIRLTPPNTFARHHQDLVLDFIERFGYSDEAIPEIKASLDQHGFIARDDEDLVNSLSQMIQQLMGRLPANLPEPIHLPTLKSYIMGSFFSPDVLVDRNFPRFIRYLSGTLEKQIYWEADLANFTGLPEEMIKTLVHELLSRATEDQSLHDDLVHWLHFEPTVTDDMIGRHLVKLDKISSLVQEWDLSLEELRYMAGAKPELHGFDWNLIPVQAADPTLPFAAWRGLTAYVAVRDQISMNEGDLIRLFNQAKEAVGTLAVELFEHLSTLLGEDYSEIRASAAHLKYLELEEDQLAEDGILRAGAFSNAESLLPLMEVLRLAKQLGCSSNTLQRWVKQGDHALATAFMEPHNELLEYKERTVESIRRITKARMAPAAWKRTARQLRDQMRILQRDHLLAAITGANSAFTVDRVYDVLWLDPQMNPCMNTTRLKQAISSVQLYIHRLLMGLEPNTAELNLEEVRTHWEWKKNYRLWEAQRKVFLYPENWIEPELRDNKTPFFEEFEGQLAQGELTAKNIGKAFGRYLRDFEQVAYLEIASFYEKDDELYVIGRTKERPAMYYYRSRGNDGQWHAWEKIDLDLPAQTVLLVVYNRVPYLFWPTIKHRVEKLGQDNPDDTHNDRTNYRPMMEITFSWSKYEDGRWQPVKKSDATAELMYEWELQELLEKPEEHLFFAISSRPNYLNPKKDRDVNIEIHIRANDKVDIKNYTWQSEKLEETFERISNLSSRIDWAYIYGDGIGPNKNFTQDSVDLIEANVQSLIQELRGQIKNILAKHAVEREELNLEASKVLETFIIGKEPRSMGHGRTYDLWGGLLGFWLSEYPFIWANKGPDHRTNSGVDHDYFHDPYEPDGLRLNDRKKIDDALNPLLSLSALITELDIYEYHYRVLTIDRENTDSKDLTFMSSVAFSGYDLTAKALNTTGLKSMQPPSGSRLNQGLVNVANLSNRPIDPEDIAQYLNNFVYYTNYDLLFHVKVNFLGGRTFTHDRFFYRIAGQHFFLERENPNSEYSAMRFFQPWATELTEDLHTSTGKNDTDKFNLLFVLSEQAKESVLPTDLSRFDIDNASVDEKYKALSFDHNLPFAIYNWEVFFHMPFTVAVRLSQQKKFAEAQQWFHYIFNPFGSFELSPADPELSPASRYWNVLPLHELKGVESMQEIWDDPVEKKTQLAELATDPFQPHRMARYRLSSYQKAVVMKYLDNLLAWGDHLFQRDTLESINEATLLYVLASRILGPRPRKLPALQQATSSSELRVDNSSLPLLNNAAQLAAMEQKILLSDRWKTKGDLGPVSEQVFPLQPGQNPNSSVLVKSGSSEIVEELTVSGIPHNEKLLSYWDTVADRLFKIRHCQNIEGLTRDLPIFEPPIDPGFLVRGAALGVSISDLLSDLYAPLPPYRFRFMLQKANEFCGEVRSLGGALLSALEKKDGEELSLLRTSHEQQMLKLTKAIRTQQILELRENLKSTRVSLEMAEARFEYYSSKKFENQNERQHVRKLGTALGFQIAGQIAMVGAAYGYALPNTHVEGSPPGKVTYEYGGKSIGDVATATSRILDIFHTIFSHQANMHSIQASRQRRWEDWQFQAEQAQKEIKQVEKQILAGEIRLAIAEQELTNHEKQIEQSQEVETFMRHKFTNQQLYQWMAGQTSSIYFQTYKMAMELARMAQRCYRFERGEESATFIGTAYWDNLKKGLLAGESLQLDLRRMEQEYLRKNTRELEVTKHISLKALDPIQLHLLRYQGSCTIDIPELLFDLDFPGQYYRRIKSLSISIPAVVGPYTGMNCTLRLNNSYTRKVAKTDDSAWTLDQAGAPKEIALSSGQNDSGLFELNYNDERYLPFELRGVQSNWTLDFPGTLEQFDRTTISDVIFHVRYTARQGGDAFRDEVDDIVRNAYEGIKANYPLSHQVDVRRAYMSDWYQWVVGTDKLQLQIGKDHFPYLLRPLGPQIHRVSIFCEIDPSAFAEEAETVPPVSIVDAFTINGANLKLNKLEYPGNRCFYQSDVVSVGQVLGLPTTLEVKLTSGEFELKHLKEMLIVFQLFESVQS